jgi:hypothetical protein
VRVIESIREKLRGGDYEFAIPHFFEELADDDLILADVQMAIANGRVRRRFTRDPRGTRYEIVGPTTNGRDIGVICRIKETGKLLFVTVYVLE